MYSQQSKDGDSLFLPENTLKRGKMVLGAYINGENDSPLSLKRTFGFPAMATSNKTAENSHILDARFS